MSIEIQTQAGTQPLRKGGSINLLKLTDINHIHVHSCEVQS